MILHFKDLEVNLRVASLKVGRDNRISLDGLWVGGQFHVARLQVVLKSRKDAFGPKDCVKEPIAM